MAVLRVLALVLLAAGGVRAQERAGELPEYVLKAGFLYNFAKYVDWPATAFEKPDSPITIGIVGQDPFGGLLERALGGKRVKERGFEIRRFAEPKDLQRCHILFVPRSEKDRVGELLRRIEAWPVLTVGEEPAFAEAGGTANVLIENEKPRLELNPDAAGKSGLTISAKLLKAAVLVRTAR